MTRRRVSAAALAIVAGLALSAASPSTAQDPHGPDVLIRLEPFQNETGSDPPVRIAAVLPRVKGVCQTASPASDWCDDHVTWKLIGAFAQLPEDWLVRVMAKEAPAQPPCFASHSFELRSQPADARQVDSGARIQIGGSPVCPRHSQWIYDVQLVDASDQVRQTVDPVLVFDY